MTALVLADTPATKLSCTAHSSRFVVAGKAVERGVMSHYAASTLAAATTVSDWLARIEKAASLDQKAGKPVLRKPLQMRVAGNDARVLPGKATDP